MSNKNSSAISVITVDNISTIQKGAKVKEVNPFKKSNAKIHFKPKKGKGIF